MLRFERLQKAFHARSVIRDCSGRFGPGIFALQGPNGIGKSTLLAVLSGALPLDAGEVWIDDLSLGDAPIATRRRLSYAQTKAPYTHLYAAGTSWNSSPKPRTHRWIRSSSR